MEKKLKVLFDVEIVDDAAMVGMPSSPGRITYSYQACGGGGGCGGCGGCGGGYTGNAKLSQSPTA